ncbi:MAG: hypothetical protein KTR30_19240 [Saprospiraceae bacterium]|nr:hypothetical protein [Saprospiraceae bacterium]
MELNELQSAWQTFKATQNLDTISEKEISQLIHQDQMSRRKRNYALFFKYSMVHTLLLFICQSC